MNTQVDYELDPTVALFGSDGEAEVAACKVAAARIVGAAIQQRLLGPGLYACADVSLAEAASGVVRGAAFGAPLGAAVGVALAVALVEMGPTPIGVVVGAGVIFGGLVGSLIGAARHVHYDDDIARSVHIADNSAGAVLIIWTHSPGQTGRARLALEQSNVLAFLDPEVYAQGEAVDAPDGWFAGNRFHEHLPGADRLAYEYLV